MKEISRLVSQEVEEEVIILSEVFREQAKAEIEELFGNRTDSLYHSDIMEQLVVYFLNSYRVQKDVTTEAWVEAPGWVGAKHRIETMTL